MKSVLITGADRGLGIGITKAYLAHGWSVYAGQFMPDWKELEELKLQYPDTLTLIPLDVSQEDSVKEAVKLVSEKTDCIDVLVNCAGIVQPNDEESMRRMFAVNTFGGICMVQHLLPLLEKGMKRICFISSEAGVVSVAHRTGEYGYCISKTALNMGIRLLFNRLRPEGFTFRMIHPGWVRSYMSGEKNMNAKLEPEESGAIAYDIFTKDSVCEDVMMLTDVAYEVWPF